MNIILQYEAPIAIAIGVFLCLFGYRAKKVAFIIIWFLIGYLLTHYLLSFVEFDPLIEQLLPIGAGILLSMLGFSIEKFCVFAVATFAVSTTAIETFQLTEPFQIALAILAGLIIGFIATSLIKPFGIITTSLSGAKLIAKYVIASFNIAHYPYFLIILCIAFIIGIFFQFGNCKHVE